MGGDEAENKEAKGEVGGRWLEVFRGKSRPGEATTK